MHDPWLYRSEHEMVCKLFKVHDVKITSRCFETQKISSNVFVTIFNVNTDVYKRSVSAKLSET